MEILALHRKRVIPMLFAIQLVSTLTTVLFQNNFFNRGKPHMKTALSAIAVSLFCSVACAADGGFLDLIRLNIGQPVHITEVIGKSVADGKLIEVGHDYFCADLAAAGRPAEKRCYPVAAVKAIGWRKLLEDPKIVVDKI